MGYRNLAECVLDLERAGELVRIDEPFDPYLEVAYIQRRAFQKQSPALLFTRPKGSRFPMLANLFGTRARVNFIFRDTLEKIALIFKARADLRSFLTRPWQGLGCLSSILHIRPRYISLEKAPVLEYACKLCDLPKLVSWPGDGGPFITLPLVYSEDPLKAGAANLGMYRIQLSGPHYGENEVGLHYQLQRGIGIHHAHALAQGMDMPVSIHIGGPPALTISAIMPLPEGMSELIFAGMLGGRRMEVCRERGKSILAQADFVLQCRLGKEVRPEGPFGDHLGYYSLVHDFPVLRVEKIHHRKNAIWPFTSVGRPPQEDTIFGDFIHELTAPMVGNVFEGVRAVHAVDAAGVHPLLLAIGSERYTTYDAIRRPQELLTQAMHLLGTTQTALAKFVLLLAGEDVPGLDCRDVENFFGELLKRTDFKRDLRFIGHSTCDTLDYSGYGLNQGSRLIWAAAGEAKRKLGHELKDLPALPAGFHTPILFRDGILLLSGAAHKLDAFTQDEAMHRLAVSLGNWTQRDSIPLVVVADDAEYCAKSFENFLWIAFTRTDPARDCYGVGESVKLKHWSCEPPLIMDARLKAFQAPPLEDDPAVVNRIEAFATHGKPLAGLI